MRGTGLLAEVITPERFPHVSGLFSANSWVGAESAPSSDGEGPGRAVPVVDGGTLEVEGEFELGLSLILDGLEARAAAARGKAGPDDDAR